MENEDFNIAFLASKLKIRTMQFQYVLESNSIRQTVLEVYCAVVLNTPYNKFETT